MFGQLNRPRHFINSPSPRELPIVQPSDAGKEESIGNNRIEHYLTQSLDHSTSPLTIVTFLLPRPWTFFAFVLFDEWKLTLVQNIVEQIDE